MKLRSSFVIAALLFCLSIVEASAQNYYCFFVDNQSGQQFYQLKIRPTGQNASFSKDLLPEDMIDDGKHFWVRTGNDQYRNWDVQIIDDEGNALVFTWQDVSGNWHKNKAFISLNVEALHTLVIGSDANGNLTFGVYNDDRFGYGSPCQ